MNQKTYMSRRAQTSVSAERLVQLVKERAVTKYGCINDMEVLAFTAGYISSMLATVAAQSPAAMRELESHLKFIQE
jgi:hypothetical protein